jgi:hypothetical protein
MLKNQYANVCFLVAIVCFMLDGLGMFPQARLFSWGSAAFTAGFIAWELIAFAEHERQERVEHAPTDKLSDIAGHDAAPMPRR